ncbi:serine/threonine protein kinase [Gammaproteobacteria bacterium]|nr:serine/threonine protein kinase [Gammaproteobacteria bacterium]
MINNTKTPFQNLDPNTILSAVETLGYACSGSLIGLNSYENRVYQIGIEGSNPLIAKFYRPNRWDNKAILEEHELSLELTDHEIPVIPPIISQNNKTLHEYNGYRFVVFPRKGGRALDQGNIDQLAWMGRFIGRLHAVSSCKQYFHRSTLNTETHGYNTYRFLVKNNFIPHYLVTQYSSVVEEILSITDELFKNITNLKLIRLHGDCHLGNILWNVTGPHIVDLDDSEMGPAIQDIWMLLSGNHDQIRSQLDIILENYCKFYEFDIRELKLIEAMRALRMIQYSAWLANRWEDPAFPISFPWFNTPHYWEEQLLNLREQVVLLTNSPYYI